MFKEVLWGQMASLFCAWSAAAYEEWNFKLGCHLDTTQDQDARVKIQAASQTMPFISLILVPHPKVISR